MSNDQPPILTTTQLPADEKPGPLQAHLLEPLLDPWERSTLQALCIEAPSWKELAELYLKRGYLQSMHPETTSRVALLAALNLPPPPRLEVEPVDQVEVMGNSRRGIQRS